MLNKLLFKCSPLLACNLKLIFFHNYGNKIQPDYKQEESHYQRGCNLRVEALSWGKQISVHTESYCSKGFIKRQLCVCVCVSPIKVITCVYLKLTSLYIGIVPDEDLRVETLPFNKSFGAVIFSVRTSHFFICLYHLVVLHPQKFGMCTPFLYFFEFPWSHGEWKHVVFQSRALWRETSGVCECHHQHWE